MENKAGYIRDIHILAEYITHHSESRDEVDGYIFDLAHDYNCSANRVKEHVNNAIAHYYR